MRPIGPVLALVAGACTALPPAPTPAPPSGPLDPAQAAAAFIEVVSRVEPVAERECRRLTAGVNCHFVIRVDRDPRAEPNAYQSVDAAGRPVIIFTIAMIADARNADEMAFVLGHEAAHHILGHLTRQAEDAALGAEIFARLARLTGGDRADVENARQIGAEVGARSYSKEYELEADQLGTLVTVRAGYDPLKGAGYFDRLPEPGNRFFGTHPPNELRKQVVVETARRLGAGG